MFTKYWELCWVQPGKKLRTKFKSFLWERGMITLILPVLVLNCCLTNNPNFSSLKQQMCVISVSVDQELQCGLVGCIQLRVSLTRLPSMYQPRPLSSQDLMVKEIVCLQFKLTHTAVGCVTFTGCWPKTLAPCHVSSTGKLTKWKMVSLRANEKAAQHRSQSLFL